MYCKICGLLNVYKLYKEWYLCVIKISRMAIEEVLVGCWNSSIFLVEQLRQWTWYCGKWCKCYGRLPHRSPHCIYNVYVYRISGCVLVNGYAGENCRVTASDTNELFPFITGVNYCVRSHRFRHWTLGSGTYHSTIPSVDAQLLNIIEKT